ncbi:MAG: divergent PAP2 family protein, partial [Candidatus Omnitrophota bacterium]
MHDFLREIWSNRILGVTLLAWFLTQALKVVLGVFRERRFNFQWLVETGGMPSSHAAGMASLATSVGCEMGFHSPIFAVTSVAALVIMFDAQGVRRASGKQAAVLNKIIDDIYFKKEIQENRLKELLGHTPVEVIVGA